MKNFLVAMIAILCTGKRTFYSSSLTLLLVTAASGELVTSQSFESGEAVNYTINPVSYDTGSDTWTVASTVGTGTNAITASAGSQFFAFRDLDNPSGGGDFGHTISFTGIDLSGFFDAVVTFDYNAFEFDNGDDLSVTINGVETVLLDGSANLSTTGWETFSLALDDNVDTLDVVFTAIQDGGGDWGGFDNFQVNATAIPEPSSFAFIGLIGAGVVIRKRRRRNG